MVKKSLYQIENVHFSYKLGSQEISALKGISLQLPQGSLITFSGPSGSGKSTLLNLLGLIDEMQEGDVHFLGENLKGLKTKEKNRIRREQIGFIFQQFHLIPVLTAEENIAYFLKHLPKKEVKARVKEALEQVGLWEHRKKKPLELSGGQRQRVAIARALVKKPSVIIADEPTASLDQKTGREIMEIFSKLVKEEGVSIIISTHDPMVQTYSDLNVHIQDGKLELMEAEEEVMA